MPILMNAPDSGMGQGISNVGQIIGQALQKRHERNQKQEVGTFLHEALSQVQPSEYPSILSQAIAKGMPAAYIQALSPVMTQLTRNQSKASKDDSSMFTHKALVNAGYELPEYVPGTPAGVYSEIAKKGEPLFTAKKAEMAHKRTAFLNIVKDLKDNLKYTGSTAIPFTASWLGSPGEEGKLPVALNRKALEKRSYFNTRAFALEGFLRELSTRGNLPKAIFEKLLEQLPNTSLSERENTGRMTAIEDTVKDYLPTSGFKDAHRESIEGKMQTEFESVPPAKDFAGKTIRNPKTGERLLSDGKTWKKL